MERATGAPEFPYRNTDASFDIQSNSKLNH